VSAIARVTSCNPLVAKVPADKAPLFVHCLGPLFRRLSFNQAAGRSWAHRRDAIVPTVPLRSAD
jgi:hypothetical protein